MSSLQNRITSIAGVLVSVGLVMISGNIAFLESPILRYLIKAGGLLLIFVAIGMLLFWLPDSDEADSKSRKITLERSPRVQIRGNAPDHDIHVKDSPDAEIDLRGDVDDSQGNSADDYKEKSGESKTS